MNREKLFNKSLIANHLRIKNYSDSLGMLSGMTTDIHIGWIFSDTAGVTNDSTVHALNRFQSVFNTPEATSSEISNRKPFGFFGSIFSG